MFQMFLWNLIMFLFSTLITSNWLFVCTLTDWLFFFTWNSDYCIDCSLTIITVPFLLKLFQRCCHHHQPGLRILTFSCNFLKSASGIDVRDQFVHPFPYQVHFSQRFYWPSLVWAATFLEKGNFSDRTSGMTILDGWLNWTGVVN